MDERLSTGQISFDDPGHLSKVSVSGGGDAGGDGQDVAHVSTQQGDVLLQQRPHAQQLWVCSTHTFTATS